MVADPVVVNAPPALWRVGRSSSPLNFSELSPEDASIRSGGNRFDVLGGGILYASTNPQGAFAETLARFRPTASMRAIPPESDEPLMAVGAIPADWRTRRLLSNFSLDNPLPFLDVDKPQTHTYLTGQLAAQLQAFGVDTLDVPTLRGSNRHLTRAISEWAYVEVDEEGYPRYSGLRYESRLGQYECWAIFRGTGVIPSSAQAIAKTDSALLEVAHAFDLSIH